MPHPADSGARRIKRRLNSMSSFAQADDSVITDRQVFAFAKHDQLRIVAVDFECFLSLCGNGAACRRCTASPRRARHHHAALAPMLRLP